MAAGGRLAEELQATGPRAWRKANRTPVSEADLAVDRLLAERLRAARPGYGWWSEESEHVPAGGDAPTWLVDPIDGTRAYLAGGPDWCVAAALVVHGRPVLAAVAEPAAGRLWWALRAKGAFRDDTPLRVSGRHRLAGARVFGDRGRLANPRGWPRPWPELTHLQRNSFVLRMLQVAAGEADLLVSLTPKAGWDLAPGLLFVEEAGGAVGAGGGQAIPLEHGRMIPGPIWASNALLADEIAQRLAGRK